MEKPLPGQQNYFEAFIKAAQYLAGLTAQQDIWSETGKLLVNFFGAEVGAVEESRTNAEAAGHRWVFSERYSGRTDLEPETREAIAEVLESGFLSALVIFTPGPLSIACFPITRKNQVVAAMVVGHGMPEPLPRELLNVYLALSGLVGTTVGRLASERELLRHRRQLQEEIAERRQAEEALLESEKRYRIVADNTYDWEFWLSPKGQFLYSSPSCQRITRHTADEFAREPVLLNRIIHPEDRECFMLHSQQVMEKKTTGEVEFRILLGDKGVRYIHHVCQPVFDEQGHYLGKRGSNRDITERKRAEDELARHHDHLEELVQERTAQLEAANKEMHAFTYTVSHDLRAPLRHIDGFLGLLQKTIGTALDEQGRHYMGAISGAAQKMGLLVDDLLSFSRMGRHALSFQPVDLEPLVREVIGELEFDAAGRDIDWSIGDLPTIRGDAPMLRMVLANLISNAIKFTRPCRQAKIEIGSIPGQTSEAVIFVRDNGVGFDMTYVDKLFGVFQRLHHADEFEGTGIGLANVRRIIARHGGRIWAQGKVDQGATFYFSLPQTQQGGGYAGT